jgi:UDP-glucose 4-epimerase
MTGGGKNLSMRVFVTGGAGYIGSVCVEALIAHGDEVCVFDNFSEGHRQAVHPRAKLVEGDLLDRGVIERAVREFSPEAVIHFAGKALVGESMTDPGLYYRTNVMGGVNLLDAMKVSGCKKIVFSSTCATYGLPEKIPMDERTPQKPINPYGHSKLLYEQILQWYEQLHGIVYVALRYFNASGATETYGEHHRIETHLIPNVLKVALGQEEQVSIFGEAHATPDGTCIRDYIHVGDLASAHIAALGREKSACYNLGTGEGHSVRQVVECARRVTGHPIPAQVLPARAGDPPRLVASAHRARIDLGWTPRFVKLADTITTAWAWHQKHPRGYER